LGVIKACTITCIDDLGTLYYEELGPLEVVDLATIHCVIGRVYDRGCWAIIDRSEKTAKTVFVEQ